MFAVINNNAKLMTRELEIECGKVDAQKCTTNRIKPTMVTLGLRFQAIRNHFKSTNSKLFEETEQWVLFKLRGTDKATAARYQTSKKRRVPRPVR